MLESSWESRYLHFSLEQIQLNAQNPSNWEEANENLQVFPHWETPELACSNSRQVVQLSHPISKQSTWICDSNLARAQIQHQVLCSCSGWNTLSARQVKLQAGAGFRQQPRAEQGWGCCWDLWHCSLSTAAICSASLSKTLKAAQSYNLGYWHSDI